MKKIPMKRLGYVNGWVLFLGILGLVMISILPIISVDEAGSINSDLHYNHDLMKKSRNYSISNYSNDVDLIILSFWVLIISGLLFYFGLILYISEKSDFLSRSVLLISSYVTTFFSCVIILLFVLFIKKIGLSKAISLSTFLNPLNYQYLTLIISVIFLICSITLTIFITPFALNYFRGYFYNRSKNSFKKKKAFSKTKNRYFDDDIAFEIPGESDVDNRSDVENWLKGGFAESEKPALIAAEDEYSDIVDDEIDEFLKGVDEEVSDIVQISDSDIDKNDKDPFIPFGSSEKKEDIKEEEKLPFDDEAKEKDEYVEEIDNLKQKNVEEKIDLEDVKKDEKTEEKTDDACPVSYSEKTDFNPFGSEVKKEEPIVKTDDVDAVPFDQVLSSVIKKNQPVRRTNAAVKPDVETNDKPSSDFKDNVKKEEGANVVCPSCETVFTVDPNQKIVKCPKCGLEGEM